MKKLLFISTFALSLLAAGTASSSTTTPAEEENTMCCVTINIIAPADEGTTTSTACSPDGCDDAYDLAKVNAEMQGYIVP